ncbi:unnamed protein product [Caretta caretta]
MVLMEFHTTEVAKAMSTLPAGLAGSDQSIGDRFIVSSVDAINRFPDRSAVISGTPPRREAEVESMGEWWPLIPHRKEVILSLRYVDFSYAILVAEVAYLRLISTSPPV